MESAGTDWQDTAMSDSIDHQIAAELDSIERDEGVRIVYACESGSRAWGFASEDSDYDVRFLYVHPPQWYLSILQGRDVIERPICEGLDISGWDLPKALQLFRKSNPPLLEWLQSPIVYRELGQAVPRMRALLDDYYSPVSCMHHYLHMARGNNREFLQGDEVWVKKYFYVLRPVLACIWIERGHGVVPTEFAKLVDRVVDDATVRNAIDDLMVRKRAGAELDRGPRIPVISEYLTQEIDRLSATNQGSAKTRDTKALDRVFLNTLVDVFGSEFA
jgi:hypothetical protein